MLAFAYCSYVPEETSDALYLLVVFMLYRTSEGVLLIHSPRVRSVVRSPMKLAMSDS